jgi:hypothetical protein
MHMWSGQMVACTVDAGLLGTALLCYPALRGIWDSSILTSVHEPNRNKLATTGVMPAMTRICGEPATAAWLGGCCSHASWQVLFSLCLSWVELVTNIAFCAYIQS